MLYRLAFRWADLMADRQWLRKPELWRNPASEPEAEDVVNQGECSGQQRSTHDCLPGDLSRRRLNLRVLYHSKVFQYQELGRLS